MLLVKDPIRSHYISEMTNLLKSLILFTLGIALFSTSAASNTLQIITPKEIKQGMKGYGLTVFKGTKRERFAIEVISVVPNFMLKQDIILIKVDHPVTDKAGIIGGMSGSPIYIENRLAGALAYGWRFSKEPLAGVTPIQNMLDVLKLKQRRVTSLNRKKNPVMGFFFQRQAKPAVSHFFRHFKDPDNAQIIPARTPLTLGGFSSSTTKLLTETLSEFGIEPLLGGGASGSKNGPRKFENGGSIGVQMIRGDMSATGIGTVTLVQGKNVLGFGHPMFNMGEGHFPVTNAEIHTVIASLARSNKLGTPLDVLGSLTQDRNACIAARTDQQAEMIPMTVGLTDSRTERKEKYQVEIASHSILTPRFVEAALSNIITHGASDTEDVTAEIRGNLYLKGRSEPVSLYDSGASRTGLQSVAPYFRPVAIVGAVMDNPFESVRIERLTFDITLHFGLEYATLVSAYVTAENPEPGEVINVHVRLIKYDDEEQHLTIPVRIPISSAEKTISVEVAGGDSVTPTMAVPRNLDDALKNVTRFFPPKSIVVSLNVPGQGISMRGRILKRLPASVVNTLKPKSGVDLVKSLKTELRKVTKTSYLVDGKESFKITVGPRRSR